MALYLQRLHRTETQCETQRRQHKIISSTCQLAGKLADMPLRLATMNTLFRNRAEQDYIEALQSPRGKGKH